MRQYIPIIRWAQMLLDLAVVQSCFFALTLYKLEGEFPIHYQAVMLISALLMILLYQWQRVYHHFRAGGLWSEVGALLKAWGAVLVVLAVLGFGSKTNTLFSREVFFTWAVVGAIAQLAVHWMVNSVIRALRARGFNERRALLVGNERHAGEFAQRLVRNRRLGIEVVGVVTVEPGSGEPPQGQDLPRLGTVERLPEIIRSRQVNLVYITLPLKDSHWIEELMHQLVPLHVDVHWVPDVSALELLNHGAYVLEGQPVLSLTDSPLAGLRRIGKWLEDKVLATIILLVASPLMLGLAAAVRFTSPGPALFKQKRTGLNGEVVFIYKFRSMVLHQEAPGQLTQALPGDSRLTPIGAFLRRTSLDELPQFINVLQGRMSIVGPRPHALEHDSYYANHIRAYMLRHRVKPGITGWAQVNDFRGEIDSPEKMRLRIKYDLYYVNNWSLLFDFLIIAMTLWRVFSSRNAW